MPDDRRRSTRVEHAVVLPTGAPRASHGRGRRARLTSPFSRPKQAGNLRRAGAACHDLGGGGGLLARQILVRQSTPANIRVIRPAEKVPQVGPPVDDPDGTARRESRRCRIPRSIDLPGSAPRSRCQAAAHLRDDERVPGSGERPSMPVNTPRPSCSIVDVLLVHRRGRRTTDPPNTARWPGDPDTPRIAAGPVVGSPPS